MKARVAQMEEEAAQLREMQAAAEAESATHASADGHSQDMETDDDRQAADGRSIYVGNVRSLLHADTSAPCANLSV
jgi:polyadenylate-binding protein 2